MQLVFLKLHNRVLDHVVQTEKLSGREAFHRAQQLVRWHYQWVVLRDFLPRLVGESLVFDILFGKGNSEPPYTFESAVLQVKQRPLMPVEFSVAAYRIGHRMIRSRYDLNAVVTRVPIFLPPSASPGPLADLRGGGRFRRFGRWSGNAIAIRAPRSLS